MPTNTDSQTPIEITIHPAAITEIRNAIESDTWCSALGDFARAKAACPLHGPNATVEFKCNCPPRSVEPLSWAEYTDKWGRNQGLPDNEETNVKVKNELKKVTAQIIHEVHGSDLANLPDPKANLKLVTLKSPFLPPPSCKDPENYAEWKPDLE